MPKIIDQCNVIDDNWQRLPKEFEGSLPEGNLLLPLQYWLENRDSLGNHNGEIGIWIDSDEAVEDIAAEVQQFPVIAVNFPAFADGRGFSTARLLRDRYNFTGQLRAVGNVIRDQLFFLSRVGFDAFQLREGYDLEAALASLKDFSVRYQPAVDEPLPLFRRR